MNLFQILAIAVLAVFFVLSALAMVRGWATRREGLIWSFIWLSAGAGIAFPKITVDVAKILGIGRGERGADLVLYCAVIVMMVGFFMVYARLRRLRRDLTLLTRHIAIQDAATAESQSDRSSATLPPSWIPDPPVTPPDSRN